MKKSVFKRGTAMVMAMVMCLMAFLGSGPLTAHAAGEKAEVYMIGFPRDGEADFNGWGHPELHYMNGWVTPKSSYTNIRAMNSYEGNICYCIEPGIAQDTGEVFTSWDENFWDNFPEELNSTITGDEIKTFIGRILQYGYTGSVSLNWRSQNSGGDTLAYAVATQLLIWETIVGERNSDFGKVDPGSYDAILDSVTTEHPLYDRIHSYYESIETNVKKHSKLPSFFAKSTGKAQEVEMEWTGSEYVAEITDSNGVLDNYTFTANITGIEFAVDGSTLRFTAKEAPTEAVTITASKKNSQRMGVITWTDGDYGPNSTSQDTVTYAQSVSDPVKGYLKLAVSFGSAKIVKTSEDGIVEGISFTITGEGINQAVTTNKNGEFQIDNLAPGTYTVTEQTYDKYETQESQQVTVISGQVTTVTFNNTLKRGSLAVYKNSEDGLNEGITFHLYGTSLSGQAVDEFAVTDSDGIAFFGNVLIGSGYTLEEVDTATKYVIPDDQTAAIEWNTVTNKSFTNILKKWNVTVTKSDASTGTAQGDGSLAGAQYGVYRGDELIDTYTTDANGQFTTGYYICGNDWTIREITPSEGYQLDSTAYPVGAEAKNYTVELNSTTMTVLETVKKGSIAIIKHTDNGDTQIETPEEGAEFCVYLKSAGSYDAAAESERDYLTCDENGFAQTKELPYGLYTIHQVSGWDGRELIADFDVFISENGEIYRYLINNAAFESFLKVIKVDAETGKVIPYAGAAFQIYNPDGTLVKQTFTYPEVTEIDTFYTNEDGYLVTPESLEYGTGYALVEVRAPYGYVINSEPVYFDVTQDDSSQEGGVTVIEVTKANTAQKGTITIYKTGEVFASAVVAEGVYQPVYAEQSLPGAVYEINAAEDIYTPDGTLRYTAGEVVDTITTGENGYATSKALYLGKYSVTEITAPEGMVINSEAHTVELVYAGQEVEITETSASFTNKRQKVSVFLGKEMEQNDTFHIGMNGEMSAVTFGLYAAEELTAADGAGIPADGLIEIISMGADGTAMCQTDLPFGSYYLKEMTTDEHYIISDEKYPFTFTYDGPNFEVVEIVLNDGDPIRNELIYSYIHGQKVGEDGIGLSGAIIGLFHADETDFTADTAILATVTAEDGAFYFNQIPFGNWIIREIEAPDGYVLSDALYPVSICEDGAVIEIQITNHRIRGNVQLTKVDKDYPENKLAGAVFDLYSDSNSNQKLDKEDAHLGTLQELTDGIYQMNDLLYGGYFVKEKIAPQGFYLDENAYYFQITENGKTVIVENEAGKGFINNAQRGSIRIEKTSEDKVVKGFTFEVEGTDITGQPYSKTFVTDEKGEIHIESLRIGTYVISEVSNEANEKYELPPDVTVTVLEGKTTVAKFYNKLIPEIPDIPKTGDETNTTFWGVIALVALAGAGVTGFLFYRDIKRKDGKK